jgi:hypothetical protein
MAFVRKSLPCWTLDAVSYLIEKQNFLSALGGTISGHPNELSQAGFWPGYWARPSRKSKPSAVNAFPP